MFMTDLPFTGTSSVKKPIKLTTKVASSGTFKLYVPSMEVTVPLVVPFTRILTPGKGSPISSVIVPETRISASETSALLKRLPDSSNEISATKRLFENPSESNSPACDAADKEYKKHCKITPIDRYFTVLLTCRNLLFMKFRFRLILLMLKILVPPSRTFFFLVHSLSHNIYCHLLQSIEHESLFIS